MSRRFHIATSEIDAVIRPAERVGVESDIESYLVEVTHLISFFERFDDGARVFVKEAQALEYPLRMLLQDEDNAVCLFDDFPHWDHQTVWRESDYQFVGLIEFMLKNLRHRAEELAVGFAGFPEPANRRAEKFLGRKIEITKGEPKQLSKPDANRGLTYAGDAG